MKLGIEPSFILFSIFTTKNKLFFKIKNSTNRLVKLNKTLNLAN